MYNLYFSVRCSLFAVFFLFLNNSSFAQLECDPNIQLVNSPTKALTGGSYKPSSNAPGEYFRALVVFAQFASDNSPVSNWTSGSMPTFAHSFIDSLPSSSYRTLTVADEIFEPGNHIISWDAGNLPAGMYVCDMKAGKFHSATKMLLLK